jgi:hypothetical protein
MEELADWNRCRDDPRSAAGHYESWFQRANHPNRPLAFWIRYTIFRPARRAAGAVGELWAIVFDGERNRHVVVKETVPYARCRFSARELDARIGHSVLDATHLEGRARSAEHTLRWQLDYAGDEPPLLLLARRFYDAGFPRAKALVGVPNAIFRGVLAVDGEPIEVDRWQGSQNHNWGSRHTDSYAWGQVAGFDGAADAFLECSTARLRLGGVALPALTVLVLRLDGRQYSLNGLGQALRAKAAFDFFDWRIETAAPGLRISAHFQAPAAAFVGLRYDDPPGGTKTCLNTKLAACEIIVERAGQPMRSLVTLDRAAFEIVTERRDHGVAIAA